VLGYENYSLNPWSADRAAYLIELISDYPNTLSRPQRGLLNENYYAAFSYAVTALQEALLRYPAAPQAERWEWELAYVLAQLSDPNATRQYADLIVKGLNQGGLDSDDLAEWFQEKEPRLQLNLLSLHGAPGALNAWLVEIGGAGSGFFILEETTGAFRASPLLSLFDFVNAPNYEALSADLTGDGRDEVVLYIKAQKDTAIAWLPRIFDISHTDAIEISFIPESSPFKPGTELENRWQAATNSQGQALLDFSSTLFPACPLTITRQYIWDGDWMILANSAYELQPTSQTLPLCSFVIDHAVNSWGPGIASKLMETLLPDWPPDKQIDGKPYPVDAAEEFRFRLGVYQALAGDLQASDRTFQSLAQISSPQASKWATAANNFQEKSQSSLYSACVDAQFCDASLVLQRLITVLPVQSYPSLLSELRNAGVVLRSSGYFDFDGDEIKEIWFSVRHHPGERLEFWIAIPSQSQIFPLKITVIDTNVPQLRIYKEEPLPPIILVNDITAFQIVRLAENLPPYLRFPNIPTTFPDRFKEKLSAARQAFYSGQEPGDVQVMLLDMEADPGLLCKATWSCDEYLYLLGVTSELAGDQAEAIVAYLRLWWDYSRSPYTSMARLKLRGAAVVPTAPNTLTPTVTVTGTPGPTATPTNTRTSDPSWTRTPTPTVTQTSTPYPEPSQTLTLTAYPTP
jgi:hypothetical protein